MGGKVYENGILLGNLKQTIYVRKKKMWVGRSKIGQKIGYHMCIEVSSYKVDVKINS